LTRPPFGAVALTCGVLGCGLALLYFTLFLWGRRVALSDAPLLFALVHHSPLLKGLWTPSLSLLLGIAASVAGRAGLRASGGNSATCRLGYTLGICTLGIWAVLTVGFGVMVALVILLGPFSP
jgi:hypothetical protein